MTNDKYSHRVVYKNYVLDIEKTEHESHSDFEMRKWYILKSIHLTNEYVRTGATAVCSLEELVNFSKIHLQKEIYNCKYDQSIMEVNDLFEKNLYISC
jgi:hypothetical protein